MVAMAAGDPPPAIQLNTNNDYWLQVGNPNDAYWVEDNPWAASDPGSACYVPQGEGTGSSQYEQKIGIHPQPGPNGEVAFRTQWRFPAASPNCEVRSYPGILSGRKPGYYSSSSYVNGHQIRLPDGSFSQVAPSGATPGTFFPLQLPVQSLTSTFNYRHLTAPTGQGQLVYDIWLQSHPGQDSGFASSSITHEIMIQLDNWGGYGAYDPNHPWYDHAVTIDGRLWHVYVTKGQDGVLRNDFSAGVLNGSYGRTGWKMIAFRPAQGPVPPGQINLAAFINYLSTRTDSQGTPWANGNEYVASVELGVEAVAQTTGDLVVYDYKVSQSPPSGGNNGGSSIPLNTNNDYWLQVGNPNDAYWVEDNAWGAGGMTEGTGSSQYQQQIGIDPQPGANGEVGFRTKWRWPAGQTEVKGYPGVLYGRKPGYASSSSYVNGHQIRLPDGSYSQTAPSGATPGTVLPLQLPLQSVKSKFNFQHLSPPTGQGQLVYDLWLQSHPQQDSGFANSSITHEIMIVLDNWGNYGAHNTPGGRNPGWYDHDVTINGKLWHVYATKGSDGSFLYNFGSLNGNYGRNGWKMVAFVPDQSALPVAPGEIDLAAFVNHLATRYDSHGNRWANGNEYLVSVELGVEPVEGTGDVVVSDFKVWGSASSGPGTGAPVKVQAESGTLQGSGVSVKADHAGYEGSGFVGSFTNTGDRLTVNFPSMAAGTYDLRIRYQACGPQQNSVVINNGAARNESFPATGSGWGTKTLSGITLAAGTQTVAIVKDWGYMEVDSLELVPTGSSGGGTPTTQRRQAETGTLSGSGVGVRTDHSGYESSGFVGSFTQTGDQLTMSFPGVVAGNYTLRIRYHAWGAQQNDVIVNGGTPSNQSFAGTGSAWGVKTISGVALAAGTNTVAIRKDWGYMNVDWIEIVPQ